MKILITNVFGISNKGDHALFDVIYQFLSKLYPDAEFCGISSNPDGNASEYQKVSWVGLPWTLDSRISRFRKGRILLKAICFVLWNLLLRRTHPFTEKFDDVDISVACPGGYIEDSNWSLWGHLFQIWYATSRGCRVFLAPQSIGPVKASWARLIIRYILNRCEGIYCRDEFSYRFVTEELGVKASTEFTRDIAFSLSSSFFRDSTVTEAGEKCVGLTVIDWGFYGDKEARQRYTNALDYICERYQDKGWRVVVFLQTQSFSTVRNDRIVADYLVQKHGCELVEQSNSLSAYLSNFSKIDFLIGSRLHSCIFASLYSKPILNFSYLPKCFHALQDLSLERFSIPIDRIDFSKLECLLVELEDPNTRSEIVRRMNLSLNGIKKENEAFFQGFATALSQQG